ncbi:MAG TPA: AgmX/PglI C-terminal domain-containing protein [Candidatus Saccharimonadales bacterium]|nr:AgmX/PglI C-terminal domain-containing protein [Candidatus Saccharimonadales bacterium]
MKSPEEQEIRAKADLVHERLRGLKADLGVVDGQIESLAPQRAQHELLDQACGSLEKLEQLGAASLFWGDQSEPAKVGERLRAARGRVAAFQAKLGEIEEQRGAIQVKIRFEEDNLEILGEDLYQLREDEERRKLEWVVERDISPVERGPQLMAWARGGEDDRLFRKALGSSVLCAGILGLVLPMIPLPMPKPFEPENMPKRVVQFIRHEKAKLIPPPPVVAQKPPEETKPEEEKPKPEKPEQKPPEKAPAETKEAQARMGEPKPSTAAQEPPPAGPAGAPTAQNRVQKAGILAFKDKFASLAKDKESPRLGADARYRKADDVSGSQTPSRSMLTTNAPGSSGGIKIASLSLGLGSGNGTGGGGGGPGGAGGIQGVPLGRASSPIAGIGPGGRPAAHTSLGASRTDEEIQIVFDRHKARFYRLYNRELRNDPTLQGQMVLRLTIEPDGSVSMCKLESSDMNAPDLAAQIVDIVRTINFGAKDVQAMTIVYPIDFLPAQT